MWSAFPMSRVYTSECVQCGGSVMELHEDEVLPTLRGHPVKLLDRFGGFAAVGLVALILLGLSGRGHAALAAGRGRHAAIAIGPGGALC